MADILIKGMEMPESCYYCPMKNDGYYLCKATRPYKELEDDCKECKPQWCPLVPVQPHGDLIDRDALIKDGWLNLHKEVIRMGGYAIHELPLTNPSIPVIIPADREE